MVLCHALLMATGIRAQALPVEVTAALRAAGIPPGAVAVEVRALDAADPAPLKVRHNAAAALNPASVMKLVTAYAALDLLGPAAVWMTEVRADVLPDASGRLHGNLYLKGGGDPKLTQDAFQALLRQLRALGVTRIEGDLVLDRSFFQLAEQDPGAFDGRPQRAYNVGADALLLDFRALRFTLMPEADGVRVRQDSPSAGVLADFRLSLAQGSCDGWRDRLGLRIVPGAAGEPDRLEARGGYPRSCGEKTLTLAPLSAERHAEGLFRALWAELGGSFTGRARSGTMPEQAIPLVWQASPPLAEIVRDMNKWSNNVMARQLFLTLDEHQPKTEAGARQRLTRWLADKGFHFPEFWVENGAGLSRTARISATHLVQLLTDAWQSPLMPEFAAALPLAGVDGTMKSRLRETLAQGRARVKSGTLSGVKSLAGYAQDGSGHWYALAFLINHPNAAAGGAAMDHLLLWVVQGCPQDAVR
jgi:D-alanyl-D-alanine carboxypeptidase/D-alanyl-D-alanine-endopeptidase (penicillin-binding protein 4)